MSGIVATYLSAASFTTQGDLSEEFAVGTRVRADCGTDGVVLGTVTTVTYTFPLTLVAMSMDGAGLTENLASVRHGNDVPSSLCNHASQHAADGRDPIAVASTGAAGVVQFATDIQAQEMTAQLRAITPSNIAALRASQVESEAGVANRKLMTPERTFQAITAKAATTSARGSVELATDAEAQGLDSEAVVLTPSNVAALLASEAEAEAGTAENRLMTPLTTRQAILVATPADIGAVPTSRTITTTAPLTGGGDLSANRTLAVSAATESAAGVSELATSAEAVAGTDTARVTPVSAQRQAFLSWLRDTVGEFVGLPLPTFNFFAPTLALPATASFTRASSGYRTNPMGLLESKTTNAPRLDYDPLTGLIRGLRVEAAGTNNWLYSEKLSVIRALTLTSVSGTFQVGETVNGGAGSGVVASVDGSVLGLSSITGTFSGTVTGVTSGATGTYSAIATIHGPARATVTSNVSSPLAPDGTATADKLVEDSTAANSHYTAQMISVTSGTTYTMSVFVYAGERTKFLVNLPAAQFSVNCYGDFDLSAEMVTAGAGATAALIEDIGGGWFRCSVSGAATATASALVGLFLKNAAGSMTYDGDGSSGLYVWGMQFEANVFPTSYIQTANTAVTRAADVCTVALSGIEFNTAEGTLFLAGRTAQGLPPSPNVEAIAQIDDGTVEQRLLIRRVHTTGITTCMAVVGGVQRYALGLGTFANRTDFRLAFSWAAGQAAACVNGGALVTSIVTGGVPGGLTNLRIGHNLGGSFLNGEIRHLAYFPRALTSTQLKAITL